MTSTPAAPASGSDSSLRHQLDELVDHCTPTFLEAHLVVLLAHGRIEVHGDGAVARAAGRRALELDDRGEQERSGLRTESRPERAGPHQALVRDHLEEATGVVVLLTIRTAHDGVEFAAGAEVDLDDARLPRLGSEPLLQQLGLGP